MTNNKTIIALTVDITPNENEVSVWGEMHQTFLTATAENLEAAMTEIKTLISDLQKNEWAGKAVGEIQFELSYSLVSFFDTYKVLKTNEVAKISNINPTSLRTYANGDKNATLAEVQKIQQAVQQLAYSLEKINLVPLNMAA